MGVSGANARSLTIGSLFAGIGGLELGLEWAGLGPTVWQVEQDPFCQRVLAKHWPDAERFDDVRTVGALNLGPVDLVCGGFPCQDLSYAGKGAGLAGTRSGLWTEYARIVGELLPRFVVVENVAALAARGLATVLGDLAALGYDAVWLPVRAADVGAPHRRERLFIVAYADRSRQLQSEGCQHGKRGWLGDRNQDLADADGQHDDRGRLGPGFLSERRPKATRLQGRRSQSGMGREHAGFSAWLDRGFPAGPSEVAKAWEAPRTIKACPDRPARLKALGNAVVPQVAYIVGCIVREIAWSISKDNRGPA